MAAFPTSPHGTAPASEIGGPAVINVRRPRGTTSDAPVAADLVFAGTDDGLPPTVLRLPNLAAIPAPNSTLNKIFSILHWCFIAIGSLIALWLIFGGRGGPKPTGEELPAAPARAQVDATPAWNPPPLDTAGDSNAPKWTPPAAAAAPTVTEPAAVAPADVDLASPSAAQETAEPVEPEAPSYDAWPQGGTRSPESPSPESPPSEPPSPAADAPELPIAPQLSAAPAWPAASRPPVANAGPVARTAARETPAAGSMPGGEAHPLDLTVPVTQ